MSANGGKTENYMVLVPVNKGNDGNAAVAVAD